MSQNITMTFIPKMSLHVNHFEEVSLSTSNADLHCVQPTLDSSTYSYFYPSKHVPHPSKHSSTSNASEFCDHLSAVH